MWFQRDRSTIDPSACEHLWRSQKHRVYNASEVMWYIREAAKVVPDKRRFQDARRDTLCNTWIYRFVETGFEWKKVRGQGVEVPS